MRGRSGSGLTVRAVMFDLDGTLADTLVDLAAAANHAIAAVGVGPHPVARYRVFAGQGAERLFEAATGCDDPAVVGLCVRRYVAYLVEHQFDHSRLFPGVAGMLDELAGRGLKMAVLSNKPDERCVEMVDRLLGRWRWDAVRGHRAGWPVKPDPAVALAMAEQLGVAPEGWAFVGDTRADVLTGRAAGFLTVGATWGFRDADELMAAGADAIIDRPQALGGLL